MIARTEDLPHLDWKADLRAAIRDPAQVEARLGSTAGGGISTSAHARFPLQLPPAMEAAIDPGDPADPVLRQVLPAAAELVGAPGYVRDPVADLAAMPVPGVIHKYRGRVLLVATGACAVHCRYCFRRHFPYDLATAAADRWRAALAYLGAHTDVREVILSGGDPLMLGTSRLRRLGDGLSRLPHVRRLRIHTRIPVVLPSRVDAEFLDWLSALPLRRVIVVHVNHARELTGAARQALAALAAAGCLLLNQAVLLAGVNDTVEALSALSERLDECGVAPYYLHMLDPVAGAAHFEVPEARALGLLAELRARLPGYLLPRLVREVPGAPAKVPLEAGRDGDGVGGIAG